MIAMALAAALSQAGAPTAPASYEAALRCAGLTQAASELEGGESREGRRLYDAALYWSLTLVQTAPAAGRGPEAVDRDQTRARIRAVRELAAEDPAALAELRGCRDRTPSLG